MLNIRTLILVLLSAFCLSYIYNTTAIAAVKFLTDEQEFNNTYTGLAHQDFESGTIVGAPPNNIQPCSETLNENTDGFCFSPGNILPGIEFFSPITIVLAGPNVFNNPNTVNILFAGSFQNPLDVRFSTDVFASGMKLGCILESTMNDCSADLIVEVYGPGDQLIGSTTIAVTSAADTFLGVISNQGITRINIIDDGTIFGSQTLASISFGVPTVVSNIPTLSEWGLIAMAGILGIVGFMVIRRRKVRA